MLTQTALERFEREQVIRGFRDRTRASYRSAVRRYLAFCEERSLPVDRTETVKDHLYHLLEVRQLSGSTANVAYTAVKLLFEVGFNKPWDVSPIPRCKIRRKPPVVLSPDEIRRVFGTVDNLKHLTAFKTIYSAGLRLQETLGLRAGHIDSEQMRILVENGKGGQSRYVMLSHALLGDLRVYWRRFRPRFWLFEGSRPGRRLHERSLQRAFQQARQSAGVREGATLHSLRHSFATHLLNDGTPLPMIQKLLGHRSIKTTMVFLNIRNEVTQVPSPLDRLGLNASPWNQG